eukprot:1149945-Pelagomonas_calceolata.AAC.2
MQPGTNLFFSFSGKDLLCYALCLAAGQPFPPSLTVHLFPLCETGHGSQVKDYRDLRESLHLGFLAARWPAYELTAIGGWACKKCVPPVVASVFAIPQAFSLLRTVLLYSLQAASKDMMGTLNGALVQFASSKQGYDGNTGAMRGTLVPDLLCISFGF